MHLCIEDDHDFIIEHFSFVPSVFPDSHLFVSCAAFALLFFFCQIFYFCLKSIRHDERARASDIRIHIIIIIRRIINIFQDHTYEQTLVRGFFSSFSSLFRWSSSFAMIYVRYTISVHANVSASFRWRSLPQFFYYVLLFFFFFFRFK